MFTILYNSFRLVLSATARETVRVGAHEDHGQCLPISCAVREELADAVRARHLAGENCKYNGGNNRNEKILQLMEGNDVITVCPEQLGGLPTPWIPSETCDGIVTAKDGRIVDQEFLLGAADYAKVGIYRVADHQFEGREFFGEQEVSSIVGSITEKDGEPYLHLHINLCDENMNIHGGHLTACRISGTCELTVTVLEGHVGRKHDEETGLNLFAFD